MNGAQFLEEATALTEEQLGQNVTLYIKSVDEYFPIDRKCTYREMIESVKDVVKGGLDAPLRLRVNDVPYAVLGLFPVPRSCDVLDPDHIIFVAQEVH